MFLVVLSCSFFVLKKPKKLKTQKPKNLKVFFIKILAVFSPGLKQINGWIDCIESENIMFGTLFG